MSLEILSGLMYEKIAYGNFAGEVTALHLNGVNGAPTTTHETVWDESTAYTFLLTNMSSPTISSASTNDVNTSGTGAWTVRVTGVDSAFAAQTEDIALNGQTGVALTKSYMSINSLEVLTAGSGLVNAGIIYVGTGTVTAGKPATVHGLITAGINKSTSFIYTVPADYTLLMMNLRGASRNTTSGGHEIAIEANENLGLVKRVYVECFLNTGSARDTMFGVPRKFSEKTQLQGKMLASAGTGPVTLYADCLLINNSTKVLF